jgi:hypothetical protein
LEVKWAWYARKRLNRREIKVGFARKDKYTNLKRNKLVQAGQQNKNAPCPCCVERALSEARSNRACSFLNVGRWCCTPCTLLSSSFYFFISQELRLKQHSWKERAFHSRIELKMNQTETNKLKVWKDRYEKQKKTELVTASWPAKARSSSLWYGARTARSMKQQSWCFS